jgi:ABC-type spermidine/putrescine transport system permease subunit II
LHEAEAALVFFVQAGSRLGFESPLGWHTILIAHVVFNASVVALVVRARFVSMGQTLERRRTISERGRSRPSVR